MSLACVDITYRYPGAEKDLFSSLSLEIPGPGFHALFGPSGVGKTSLARIITGAIAEYRGRISHQGLAVLLYSYNLERLPGWSGIGNHLDKVISPAQEHRKDEIIHFFGLEECLDLRFPQLSLGQKNRINLARYLLQDFDLLIMDESLANVDEPTREKIILNLKEMFPERYFLYISHNVVEVAKFCRRILVLREAAKQPQVRTVQGLDYSAGQRFDNDRLKTVMLEIMNAA